MGAAVVGARALHAGAPPSADAEPRTRGPQRPHDFARHTPAARPAARRRLVRAVVFALEIALYESRDATQRFTLLVDLRGFERKNFDQFFIAKAITTIFTHYPNRMHRCLLRDAPLVFNAAWAIVRTWIPESLSSKFVFVKGQPDEGDHSVLTDYVATRWYRAPEILLGSQEYGCACDMWSLGCIFGEMLCGKPIFAGTSTLNQVEKIVEAIGKPNDAEVASQKSPFAEKMIDSLNVPPGDPRGWAAVCPGSSSEQLEL